AVVEGALERAVGALAPAACSAPGAPFRDRRRVVFLLLAALGAPGGEPLRLGGCGLLRLAARLLGRLELGGDQRIVLGAKIDLLPEVGGLSGAGLVLEQPALT